MKYSKVSILVDKGTIGKSSIAREISYRLKCNLITNEDKPDKVAIDMLPEKMFKQLESHDKKGKPINPDLLFPIIPKDVDVIFDLAGQTRGFEDSVNSALEQSDLAIIPVTNKERVLEAGAYTILELLDPKSVFKGDILIIANMLKTYTGNKWVGFNYRKGKDFLKIQEKLLKKTGLKDLWMMPLKYSEGFEKSEESKKTIQQMI